jgi:hypothetical protein
MIMEMLSSVLFGLMIFAPLGLMLGAVALLASHLPQGITGIDRRRH